MHLIPYREFVIHSCMSIEQITSTIEEETTTKKNLFYDNVTTPFSGKVTEKGFKLDSSGYNEKGFYANNSFRPVNVGRYEETEKGIDILVKQRLAIGVLFFISFCLVFLSLITIGILGSGDLSWALVPLFMIVVIVGMVIACFNSGAKKDQKLLEDLL